MLIVFLCCQVAVLLCSIFYYFNTITNCSTITPLLLKRRQVLLFLLLSLIVACFSPYILFATGEDQTTCMCAFSFISFFARAFVELTITILYCNKVRVFQVVLQKNYIYLLKRINHSNIQNQYCIINNKECCDERRSTKVDSSTS